MFQCCTLRQRGHPRGDPRRITRDGANSRCALCCTCSCPFLRFVFITHCALDPKKSEFRKREIQSTGATEIPTSTHTLQEAASRFALSTYVRRNNDRSQANPTFSPCAWSYWSGTSRTARRLWRTERPMARYIPMPRNHSKPHSFHPAAEAKSRLSLDLLPCPAFPQSSSTTYSPSSAFQRTATRCVPVAWFVRVGSP